MNELDVLSDRLRELGQQAPVPATDPLHDVRRGRVALRRRHARRAAGVSCALAAVGVVAANVGAVGWPGSGTGSELGPSGDLSGSPAPAPAPTPSTSIAANLCSISVGRSSSTRPINEQPSPTRSPEETAALTAYRAAASAVLDPSSRHLDAPDNERSDNVQSGFSCDAGTGEYLTSLGTSIGWTGGGALGVVRVEVVAPEHDQEPNVVLEHDGWFPYRGHLPAGVLSARIVTYAADGGGHAVVVKRADGLTVAVSASGRWGNNVAPGSPSATGLPALDELVRLAASPQLVLPDRRSR